VLVTIHVISTNTNKGASFIFKGGQFVMAHDLSHDM